MSRRHGRCIALCLCFLLIGIVIGGCIIAASPGHNRIHLTVMPNQALNVSPETGDLIDWVGYEKDVLPAITFSSATGRPCQEKNPASTCQFNDLSGGIFIYRCNGSALCDPGIGPRSATGQQNRFIYFLSSIARTLVAVVFAIDRTLGFLPAPTATSPPARIFAPSAQAALLTARAPDYDAAVGCGNPMVDPPNIDKTLSGNPVISWGGSSKFTLTIDPSVCSGDTSNPDFIQTCKLIGGKVDKPSTYTVNDDSCTNQKTATATITPR
jgi:hypothetical protein